MVTETKTQQEAPTTELKSAEAVNLPATAAAQPEKKQEKNVRGGAKISPIIPRDLAEMAKLVQAICASGMVPASYEVKNGSGIDVNATRARLMIGMMKAMECGFAPITGVNTIMVVNNRPCIWGDGAVALAQKQGAVEWMKSRYEGEEGKDNYTSVVEIKRKGQDEPYVGRFSIGDAKKARLWGNPKRQPWMMYPYRMLFNRARAFALRDGFSDCLSGLSIAEEMNDVDIEKEEATVDTGFLDDEPVQIPVTQNDDQDAEVEGDDSDTPTSNAHLDDQEPQCETCNGKGVIEDDEGKGPCPDCQGG